MAGYATNCSIAASSVPSSRPKSQRTGASSTTVNGPHSALGMLSPAEFARMWAEKYNQPQLS
jgi:hypothetical protein